MPPNKLHKTASATARERRPRGGDGLHKTGSPRGAAAAAATSSRTSSTEIPRAATLRRQYVRCGKPACGRRHGPYWYAYWKADGRTRSRYIGSDAKLAELLRARGDLAVDDQGDDDCDELPEHVEAALARYARDGLPDWPPARTGDRGLLFAQGLVDGKGDLTNRGWAHCLTKDAWERGNAIVRRGAVRGLPAGEKPTAAGDPHGRRRPFRATSTKGPRRRVQSS